LIEILRKFVNDVTNFTCRKRLVCLKQHACCFFNIELSEEIVVLGQDETIRVTGVFYDTTVVSTELKFVDTPDPLDIVVKFL